MPDVTVNIDVYCGRCGAGLCHQTAASAGRYGARLDVEPCGNCMNAAEERGYESGYDKGVDDTKEV